MFKLTNDLDLILTTIGVHGVPANTSIPKNHRYWRFYQQWLDEGNEPEPADPEPTPPTNTELIDGIHPVVLAFMEAVADNLGVTNTQMRNAILAKMR